jgi:hypothetical protein
VKFSGVFIMFDWVTGGGDMYLSLGIILDELAPYKPIIHKIIHKMRNTEAEFRQFHYYDRKFTETDPRCLYVLEGTESGAVLPGKPPAHAIIAGKVPGALADNRDAFDTLIQIPGGVSAAALLQAGHALFDSFETWHNALLMAII